MHRIMKRLLSLGLGLLLAASLPATALAAEETGEAAAQAAVETAMTYGGAVSAQFALWEDGEITLSGTSITRLTLRFRQYSTTNEQSLLLPLRQTLAIAADHPGVELSVGYADGGGDTVSASWLAD